MVFLFFRFKPKIIKQKYGAIFRILLSESKEEKGETRTFKKRSEFWFWQISFFVFRFQINSKWRKRAGWAEV